MGLDVYLYKCPNRAEKKVFEDRYEEECEVVWNCTGETYGRMTEEEKEEARIECDKLREKYGINEHDQHHSVEEINLPSELYPDHMFKIGYFRSSYNEGGINWVMERRGLPRLEHIFDFNRDDINEAKPIWNLALKKVKDAIQCYKNYCDSSMGQFDVMCVSIDSLGTPKSVANNESDALNIFTKRYKEWAKCGDGKWSSFGSNEGSFFLQGMETYAVIPGRTHFGDRCVYAIYKTNKDNLNWYLQALEIVQETIEYVLAQPDKDDYYLYWSG